ncbi:MAG: NADH-quinone oxidoreductase subunit NuoH [Deltaproteobacteria bacterium]|nr:NADH-quinone oxidoreductase subunit NuoH [Deltaproteobacteria bacterium]
MDLITLAIVVVKIIVVFIAMLLTVAYLTWVERKVLGHMQLRYGPMRTGWHGLLQPIADGIKLFFKEDIVVDKANKIIYRLSPFIVTVCAFASFAVVPFGNELTLFGKTIPLRIADVNIGILYIFALSSLSVYGLTLAGWSSNNKYSLMGGLRASAQMISYELAAGLSIIGVLMLTSSLSMVEIVNGQSGCWFIFKQPVAFIVFLICAIAECNRTPFDLPEAESELVAGFHVEYSSMKFALFFMAEYAHMVVMSALITTLFLGGWQLPFVDISSFQPTGLIGQLVVSLLPVAIFCTKVFLILFFIIWLRATYPRLRYDQLMKFGWKVLFPLALFNVFLTAILQIANII